MTKSVTINKEIVKTENLAFYKRDFFRSQKTPKEERFKKVCVNLNRINRAIPHLSGMARSYHSCPAMSACGKATQSPGRPSGKGLFQTVTADRTACEGKT